MMQRPGQSTWPKPARPPSGWQWSFCLRDGEVAETLALRGIDPQTIRTPKLARLEATLLVAGGPLTLRKIVQFATLADTAEGKRLIEQLNVAYDRVSSPYRVERVATGYQLLTRPEYAYWLSKLHQRQAELKLTPPALETLTILAYRQPMTRADLERMRGVQCIDILKMLMDRGLVRIAGEDQTLGRPFLYETTRKFLETYGLRGLDDLPMAKQLRREKAVLTESADDAEAA